MKLHYYPETDSLYIELKGKTSARHAKSQTASTSILTLPGD